MVRTKRQSEKCDTCGSIMTELQPCHLQCRNCGAQLDCTDKGTVW